MFDRIILPLDGSVNSEIAVPVATRLAALYYAPITLLHIFDDIRELTRLAVDDIEWSDLSHPRAVIEAPAWLEEATSWVHAHSDSLEIIGRIGDPAEQIRFEADQRGCSVIVMGSHGKTGLRRMLFGSVAHSITNQSSIPVILVSPGDRHPSLKLSAPTNVFDVTVFVDGSEDSERSIPYAVDLVKRLNVPLRLVHVAPTMFDHYSSEQTEFIDSVEKATAEQAYQAAEKYLAECSENIGTSVTVSPVVLLGTPDRQIRSYLEGTPTGMVVIAMRTRTGIERATYDSVASEILGFCPQPVMLVPWTG